MCYKDNRCIYLKKNIIKIKNTPNMPPFNKWNDQIKKEPFTMNPEYQDTV